MSQQFQPALVSLRGWRDHQILELLCHSFLQPSFCIMLFAAACSAQQCVSAVFMAGVCMSFCLILTTTLRSLVVFCRGASFDIGASEAPLMPPLAANISQSFRAFLQSLLNRLGPKSKRSPGTACFAQLLSADHIDNNFFASRWTPEARVGVASPATSGASSEAKHRRYQSTCGLPMQCLNPRIMLSTSLCSAIMPVFLFSRVFLHTAFMQIFSPNMSAWYRLPPAAVVLPQELPLFACAFEHELAGGRMAFLFPLRANAGVLCSILGRQRLIPNIAKILFTLAALACYPFRCCLIFNLQRARLATCLCAPTFQILALKRVGGLPATPACRSVPLPRFFALLVRCLWQLGVVLRTTLSWLHLCGWCPILMMLVCGCCLHWLACVSLLAAPASVRSRCGSSPGGCCFCVAARCLCAPLAQVPQPRVVSSIKCLRSASWRQPLLSMQALDAYMIFLCCFRCLRRAFWPAKLRPPQPVWCMSMPRSLRLLCAFIGGWRVLRRVLGILLCVALVLCLKGRPRKPKPEPLARAPLATRWPTRKTTHPAASAQRLPRPPGPGLDPRSLRGPSRAPNNDASPSPVHRSQLGPSPPSPPAPQTAATPHLPVLWSALTVLKEGRRYLFRPPTSRAKTCSRRLHPPQRRGLLLITLILSLWCVPNWASTGRLPVSYRRGPCHVAHDSAVRCWSGQLCAARATFSSCAFVPYGHNRQRGRRHPVWALQGLLRTLLACVVPSCLAPSLVLHWTEGARAFLGDVAAGHHSWLLHAAGFLCAACLLLVLRWGSTRQCWSSRVAVQQGGGRRVSHLRLLFYLCLLLIAPVAGMDHVSSCAAAEPLPPQVHHKRSLGRAVRRASAQAFTFYKGKRVSYKDLTGHTRPTAPCRFWPTAASHRVGARQSLTVAPSGRRLRLFCWNCGGMGDSKYAEFNHWLDTRGQDVDVALVTETHWKCKSEDASTGLYSRSAERGMFLQS